MNVIHNLLCSSRWWSRVVEDKLVPWGLAGVELGDDVLEVGPGFGATTALLARKRGTGRLTALELDERYCRRLRSELGDAVEVIQGDATALPFDDGRFSAVLCFTMLHHIALPAQQDRMFVEVARVLRPGGVFAGTDSLGTGLLFKLIHIGDTLLPVEPAEMPRRLQAAGLCEPVVDRVDGSFRFHARRPLSAAGG
jgi:ubiquinone/menaquinone biosynthesis C-methylase UbiE